jgi:3-hydroxybutyryl-CoA dehydrogenase
MHFMNPVPVMKLVEIINGFKTSEDSFRNYYNIYRKQLEKHQQ